MSTLTFLAEGTKTTALLGAQTTAAAHEAYLDPTAGSLAINLRAIATMGNAADVVLSLKYADDDAGTNATDFADNVPLYVDGVRQTDAKAHTVTAETGTFVVDFCVDPALIPEGKFVGVHVALSNAANLIATMAVENATEKPSA